MDERDFPDLEKRRPETDAVSTEASEESVGVQIAREKDHEIKYRSCSWQKVRYAFLILVGVVFYAQAQTAALLFSEYICLAILSFPWSVVLLDIIIYLSACQVFFCVGSRSGNHRHPRRGRDSPVHIPHPMALLSQTSGDAGYL